MATSVEKLPVAVEHVIAGVDLPGPLGMLVPQLLPTLLAQMPQDPDQLDGALTTLAQQLLDLRSDDAPRLAVLPRRTDAA